MSSVQITVRSISKTPAIHYHIDRHFNKLKKTYTRVNNCRVVIDIPKNHSFKDKVFSVSVNITLPQKELSSKKQNSNIFIAIRDAFNAIEQLIEKSYKKKSVTNRNFPVHFIEAKKHYFDVPLFE